MRIGKRIWAVTIVACLMASSAWATSINRRSETVTSTVTGTVDNTDVTPYGRFSCYKVCPPAAKTTARAIDHATGEYFEAVWTIVHPTNTDGCCTLFDLSAGAVVDSLISVRLLAGLTYGGDELVGDSIAVFIWDVDDTCYLFGRGTLNVERDWEGD